MQSYLVRSTYQNVCFSCCGSIIVDSFASPCKSTTASWIAALMTSSVSICFEGWRLVIYVCGGAHRDFDFDLSWALARYLTGFMIFL